MSVLVARAPIQSVTRLSDRGWGALQLIKGGVEWLKSATRDEDELYHFDDETEMVAAIQSGLHASDLVLLPRSGLLIGPARLMELPPGDLKVLVAYEGGDSTTRVQGQVKKILKSFVTVGDLQLGPRFLSELLPSAPAALVFQVMSLDEQIALAALADASVPGELGPEFQSEAAGYAIEEARNPCEFIDYYWTYLDLTAGAAAGGVPLGSAEDRRRRVQGAVEELQQPLFAALYCPRISDPSDVASEIAEWIMYGNRIGFARVSTGIRQIVANTRFGRPDFKETADLAVSTYLDAATSLLSRQPVQGGVLGQDGATRVFTIANEFESAVVTLGADRILTLTGYRRPVADPAQPPQSATAKEKK
jgi:hypothetical protein